MKKLLAILLAALLLVSLIACGQDTEDGAVIEPGSDTTAPADTTPADTDDGDDKGNNEGNEGDQGDEGDEGGPNEDVDGDIETMTVELNKNTKGIKMLGGRSILSDSQINCDWSGSGIEFVLRNTSLSLSIEAKSSAPCRFKVYVNGELFESPLGDEYYEINGDSVISLSGLPLGNITVRLVKITEQAMATAQFTKMTFSGILSADTPDNNEMYIEFLGGAETVGAGLTEGEGYETQDATQAYSYLLAEALEADYSIMGMSSLSTVVPLTAVEDVAALYAMASPARDQNAQHDFARKADVVVVDLGAVDAAIGAISSEITPEAFAEKYEALLTAIREKNGEDCKIVCVYTSAMGDFATALMDVCRSEMGGQQEGIYTCQMSLGEDNALSAEERAEFLTLLQTMTENAINGVITERELDTEASGGGLSVDFNTFVPVA